MAFVYAPGAGAGLFGQVGDHPALARLFQGGGSLRLGAEHIPHAAQVKLFQHIAVIIMHDPDPGIVGSVLPGGAFDQYRRAYAVRAGGQHDPVLQVLPAEFPFFLFPGHQCMGAREETLANSKYSLPRPL